MKKTTLYNEHISLKAKMVPFAGYYMPVNYDKGLQYEYDAIRKNVGMFDVSHMGQIFISGPDSESFLSYVTTNNIQKLNINDAQYNIICTNEGGIIDDIIIYKLLKDKFLMIVNASNILNVEKWLQKCINNSNYNVKVNNSSDEFSLVAVQGPNSRLILSKILNKELDFKFYTFKKYNDLIISRTGYTGELGFELIGPHEVIRDYWNLLIEEFVVPCGLAVRDILRMEMKYCLYGNDINLNYNHIEAGLHWIVDKNKNNFIGMKTIKESIDNKPARKLICFELKDRAIPRKDYKIIGSNQEIGIVTSGTFSLGLQKGIGLGYINSKIADEVIFIEIRSKLYEAKIIAPPFIKNTSLYT